MHSISNAPAGRPFPGTAAAVLISLLLFDGAGALAGGAVPWATVNNGQLAVADPDDATQARPFLDRLRRRPRPAPAATDLSGLYRLSSPVAAVEAVGTVVLRDAGREKEIPIRVTFPSAPAAAGADAAGGAAGAKAKLPLLIFCHGALGSKDNAAPLVEFWAGHGYVVIQPTFGDSLSLMTPAERRAVRSLRGLLNSRRVTGQWDDRPRDVSSVLDALDQVEAEVEALRGRIDFRRVGVAGHSFGAHTALLLSGLTLYPPGGGRAVTLGDERVKAAVMISPQGTGPTIRPGSFATLAVPSLMITGDNDGSPMRGQEGKKGTWRREAFDHAPAGDRYLLWIDGAHHGFGGINGTRFSGPGAGPADPRQVALVKSTALAFFDAYLKRDPEALAYLAPDAVQREGRGLATLSVK